MSQTKSADDNPEKEQINVLDSNLAVPSDVSSIAGSAKTNKQTTSERQIKFERAQKCLENAALVSKRIKEHRKATAELLGRPFDDDGGDIEITSNMSEKTNYSITTDTSTTLSVQDALNIPGISESLANTLKQKELLMERIKQYKEMSKRPIKKNTPAIKKEPTEPSDTRKISENVDVIKLTNTIKEKENALSIMQVKLKAMETTILDLQEKIYEKDQIIESKNKATTIITDSLSKKERDTLDLLEDTKQQMTKMQDNFVTMEMEWKEEKQKLLIEIQEKDEKIKNLEEANTILENSRFEISIENSKLTEELDLKMKEIVELQDKLKELSETQARQDILVEKEKGSLEISSMNELTKKIELLEQINCQMRQTNKELENQLSSTSSDIKSPGKKGSPLPTRKGGRNTSKMKSPWSQLSSESLPQDFEKRNKTEKSKTDLILQSLNKDILDKEIIITQKDETISMLESTVKEKTDAIHQLQAQINLQEKSGIDACIMTEVRDDNQSGPYSTNESEEKLKTALEQITTLNNEIDLANKNMIKVKSNSKLKLKQMQKSIDNFSKVSDAHAEIVKLNEELHQLSQKVAELEEEKGNLQLHLVDYDGGRLTESEVYKKMVEMENLAEARLKSITLLETQKFDLVQDLHYLQQKTSEMDDRLADMSILQNEQVCSEMKLVQLEEQLDDYSASKREMEIIIENLKLDKDQLNGTIKMLQSEKDELSRKLDSYIQENIELTDKLEKMSAEKVSSAESIEIVESLTTQEKMELEEYNRSLESTTDTTDASNKGPSLSKEELINETEELRKKIELFTQERQEVMEKMNKISTENESLLISMGEVQAKSKTLQLTIEFLTEEKQKLTTINEDLYHQIDELKKERIEVLKETAEVTKRASIDDVAEGPLIDVSSEDKSTTDKGINRSKSVKQLTKEILKLKNIIKEREDEIADCQMKILSLEEQQEKQKELLQSNASYEDVVKRLSYENNQLRNEISNITKDSELIEKAKKDNEMLQLEIQKIHNEYSSAVNIRESRIYELENALLEYEKQAMAYVNSLQQKDKEISDYVNQITKLNDISHKLKSTLDLLEEEKAKNQNEESIKSLTKQISMHQKTLADYEERLRTLEDEKHQLTSIKSILENKNNNIEAELKSLHDKLKEKEVVINEMQILKHNQSEELSKVLQEAKERDEEIHEIKLQLRKESIENEKLRTSLEQTERELKATLQNCADINEKLNIITSDKNSQNEQLITIENKNKELLEKLKKFAINIKKKSAMNTELENQLNETRKELEKYKIQNEVLSVKLNGDVNEKLNNSSLEINRLQVELMTIKEKSKELLHLQEEFEKLHVCRESDAEIISKLYKDLSILQEENQELKKQEDNLNKKVAECEVEQKNNINLLTKLSCLEAEISQKEMQIANLSSNLQNQEEKFVQLQYSYEAKIQERELYAESLQSEMDKYKERIYRLEQSISVMENSRQSLERKADQLDFQLQDKQKAYSEYMCQEDELVARLAVLIDHDRVVEKRLQEIEDENNNLKNRIAIVNEELQKTQKLYLEFHDKNEMLEEKLLRNEAAELEILDYQNKLREMETNLKHLSHENQSLQIKNKTELEDLESEFHTQIENTIKDKKTLIERYEKLTERNIVMESELQQYKVALERLNINLEELSSQNEKLVLDASNSAEKPAQSQDYTEQYINEINKLNSQLNSKNDVINDLNSKLYSMQTDNLTNVSNMNTKISDLTLDYQYKIELLEKEIESLKQNNEYLQTLALQKEEQIKQLKENNKLVFEMNIPKTEGMTISSIIEPLSDEQREPNISAIESQILDDTQIQNPIHSTTKRSVQNLQTTSQSAFHNKGEVEPLIISKKAYICHEEVEKICVESDPFNSKEGWGLETSEETEDVTPGLSHLNQQIQILKDTNLALKNDLEISNNKLIKAIKKLKELKAKNEMLGNELKLSKQLSGASLLDIAIEKELSSNVETLEKKLDELNSILTKEKIEKEGLKKQNDVLKNANDRLIEMKEKADSEIQLWKYNLKQANDKLSAMQWGGENKDTDVARDTSQPLFSKPNTQSDELIKLEKENDELQALVESLSVQNKDLLDKQKQLELEIYNHSQQVRKDTSKCEMCQEQLELVKNLTVDLEEKNRLFAKNVQDTEKQIEILKIESDNIRHTYEEKLQFTEENLEVLKNKNSELLTHLETLRVLEVEANTKIVTLSFELEAMKSAQLVSDAKKEDMTIHKYTLLEETCSNLKMSLDDANDKVVMLERSNNDLLAKCTEYERQVSQLNIDIINLNKENDQLLSTVTELRSSISSAMDQRGFEIAELWKQHLAQRESEFQTVEKDLRNQLNASQEKYEQLLENMQSSSQEETNKIIVTEQITSLLSKLKEKEEHIISLQEKYAEAVNQLDCLRSEIEDEKNIYENKVQNLNSRQQEQVRAYEEKIKELEAELNAVNTVNNSLNLQIEDIRAKHDTQIEELTKQLQIKESEIFQKTHDLTISLTDRNLEFESVRKQLIEYEKRVEELTFEKESELAVLRLKIHEISEGSNKIQKELERDKNGVSEALNEKIIECTNLNKTITDLNKVLEEYANRATESQMVLESQELEIVTLKDEITNLEKVLRTASNKIEKHVTFATDTKSGEGGDDPNKLNKELLEAVPKAELDLALYMLHQRDVRCEELTMELTQLLEERDTLQLRLSDSLRSYEELRSQMSAASLDVSSVQSESISDLPGPSSSEKYGIGAAFVETHRGQTSRSSSISDVDGGKPNLQAKLSELRGVKHHRDVLLRHESEQRQLDMRLLHRDVANMPPQALDQLAQAQHTLSRDTQSTPTVLLNWLRGKSTPKVVHM